MTVKEVIRKIPVKKYIITNDHGEELFYGTHEKWMEDCPKNRLLSEMEVVECYEHDCVVFLIVRKEYRMYLAGYANYRCWIEDADSYICPECGFATDNPDKYYKCICPRCWFSR